MPGSRDTGPGGPFGDRVSVGHKWWAQWRGGHRERRAGTLSLRGSTRGGRSWSPEADAPGLSLWGPSECLNLRAVRLLICKAGKLVVASWGYGKELGTILGPENMVVIMISLRD